MTLKKQKPIKVIQIKGLGIREKIKNIYPIMGFKQGNYDGIMKYLVGLKSLKVNFNHRENQSSLKSGYTASFSERIGSLIGQSIAKSESFHRIPRSSSGE